MFKISAYSICLLCAYSANASYYDEAKVKLANAPLEIKEVMKSSPSSYEFQSRFSDSSSVSYTGQTFRQVLISDLKGLMSAQRRGRYNGSISEAENMLTSYFNYKEENDLVGVGVIDGFSEFSVRAKFLNSNRAEIYEGFVYSDIQSPGKNLASKIAGIDNSLRRGQLYGTTKAKTPRELVNVYFKEFSKNSTQGEIFSVPNGGLDEQKINLATVTKEGIDLSQLTQKFLHGAVSYSQAARDYLSTELSASKGLNADNTKPAKQGASYTALEHHFDEAFGYFGAARDFSLYSDKEASSKGSLDSNDDGLISLLSEVNLGISVSTSRIDRISKDGLTDLSKEAIEAFLKGRHLITTRPEGYLPYVIAQARIALGAWEKTFAAVVVHYINKTISESKQYGTNEYLFKDYAKFWSEMKGYAFAFQFNPKSILSDKSFDQIHALLGERPTLPHESREKVMAYQERLLKARRILQKTYGFSSINVSNW